MLPSISYAIGEIILRNLNDIKCLNIAQIEKVWFMTPMESISNGKCIMAPKDMVLREIVFRNGIRNDKKFNNIKDTMSL